MSKRDYYEVLSVTRTATDQEIKSAYRRLAVKYHPDKNPNDATAEEKFKEAAEAYSVLSNDEQRKRYDRFGHAGVSSSAGAGSWARRDLAVSKTSSVTCLVLAMCLVVRVVVVARPLSVARISVTIWKSPSKKPPTV